MDSIFNISWKWEDMCGPSGFQPWNETSKDFGICFQELYFQIPVYFLIAVVSGYYVGYRRDWVIREKTQERAIVLRSFIVLALVFIPIIEMYIFITNINFVLYPIDYFAAGAACLSWLVHFGYVLALKHRLGPGARGPVLLLVLWSLSVITALIALRSSIINRATMAYTIANLCCHALYFLTLIPSSNSRPTFYSPCLVGSQHSHSEYTSLLPNIDDDVLGTAMQGAGFLSKLTFFWVNPLLKKGLEGNLNDPEELFDLPAKYHCEYVGDRLDRALIGDVDRFQHFAEVPHEPFIASGYGSTGETAPASTPVTPTSRVLIRSPRRYNVSLLRALHSCFGLQFYSIGVLKLIADMSGFAGPLLLNRIVTFVEDANMDPHWGYIYAGGLLAATLGGSMFNVQFNWLMSTIGIKMRGALVSAVLTKTLGVTSTKLTNEFSVGEITNFMSTDTDRIVNSCPSFHALWSIPLQLFITLFLLYNQVGISFLAGVAFSVILIPINKMVANKIGHLSTEMMRHKDTRVSLVTDMLRGIQAIKVHVWEDYFINRLNEARTEELRYLRGRKYLDAICVVLWATTPVLVTALTLATHSLRGQALDAATVFTTVALINMLISPLNAFPWVLNGITEAWVSIKRIQKLLDLNDNTVEEYYDEINTNFDEDKTIIFKNASFSWAKILPRKVTKPKSKRNKGKSKKRSTQFTERRDSNELFIPSEPFTLKNLNLEITKGDLLCVMGSVGSGKSSLLMAIMGEMVKKSGSLQMMKNLDGFGYVAQKAWLVRGTIRDNILFGSAYDEAKFKSVVHACALTEDLNALGWNAYVGEGGCTLSGGQKTRIALARAVYQDKEVYLLDDVLSGLDGTVAAHIMRHCVNGYLRHKTRILVTHNVRHVTNMCVVLNDGVIVAQGPPDRILHEIEDYLPSETESIGEEAATVNKKVVKDDIDACQDNVSRHSLDNEESMAQGSVGWWVIGLYLRSVGCFLSISIILSLLLMQFSQNLTFLWLAYWVESRATNTTQSTLQEKATMADHGFSAVDNIVHTIVNSSISLIHGLDGHSIPITTVKPVFETQISDLTMSYNDRFYLEVYFGLAALNLLFTVMRAFLFAYGGVKAAERIHKVLVKVIIKAKMEFFDMTPIGRIVNRFSSDTYTIDDSLPFIMNIMLAQFFGLVGALAVTLYAIPWLLTAVVPMSLLLYYLQRRYRVTSRQLKRLQSVTLSPVYAHFSDTLEGLCSVRALGGRGWRSAGRERCGRWQRCGLAAAALAAWLAARLQAGAALAVCACCLLPPTPGLIGLALSYALSVTGMLSGVLNAFTETEREMIAVERVGEYIKEVEMESSNGAPPPYGWPAHGVIEFQDVTLKYTANSPNALNSVSFSTGPGEKLGICGRTGAGKSSILRAILKLAPVVSGRASVDGIDVRAVPSAALRSRIAVIPQEPFIFSGSIRSNLDPLQQYSESELCAAAAACGLRGAGARARGAGAAGGGGGRGAGGLDDPAGELSRGHKQLLCVARAMLHRPKILLVDEATANLDVETERLILETIQNKFSHATVVFIAHRVASVLQCERVLVLGGGKLLDLRPPHDALADRCSPLYMLLNATENQD